MARELGFEKSRWPHCDIHLQLLHNPRSKRLQSFGGEDHAPHVVLLLVSKVKSKDEGTEGTMWAGNVVNQFRQQSKCRHLPFRWRRCISNAQAMGTLLLREGPKGRVP
jgi:hypothetical protein